MLTTTLTIDQVLLVVPKLAVDDRRYDPFVRLSDFPDSCGAGRGIGQIIVPETMFGLRVSAACYTHDLSWEYAEKTWADFHQTNSMFLRNMLSIIEAKSRSTVLRVLRNYRAMTYYNSVDTAGAVHFFKDGDK